MTEHVSRKVRPLHKEYFALLSKSKADVLTGNRNTWLPSGTTNRSSGLDITIWRPTGRVSLSSGPPSEIPLPVPEFQQWRELVDPRTRQRLAEEIFIPDRNQADGGKISHIKDGDPVPKGTFLSWNAQSILNKKPKFTHLLFQKNIDIVCLSETFLKPHYNFHIPHYTIYRTDRPTHTQIQIPIPPQTLEEEEDPGYPWRKYAKRPSHWGHQEHNDRQEMLREQQKRSTSSDEQHTTETGTWVSYLKSNKL